MESFKWDNTTYNVDDSKLDKVKISKKVAYWFMDCEYGAWEDDGKSKSKYHPYNLFSNGYNKGYILIPINDTQYIKLIKDSVLNSIDIACDHVGEDVHHKTLWGMENFLKNLD